MPKDIATESEFQTEISSSTPTLVDFWAEWCGPCRMVAPVLDDISKEMAGKLNIVKVNIEENTETPTKVGVRSIPTLILYKDGKALGTKVGSLPKASLIEWINSLVNA